MMYQEPNPDETCIFCRTPALMGFHPRCVLKAARVSFAKLHPEARIQPVCKHCPFRKKSSQWLDQARWVLNKLRLKFGSVQNCHKHPERLCGGNWMTLRGGSPATYSIEEFKLLTPCQRQQVLTEYEKR